MVKSCKPATFLSLKKLGGFQGGATVSARVTQLRRRLSLISDGEKTGQLARNKKQQSPGPKQSHASYSPKRNENIKFIRKRPAQKGTWNYSSVLKTGNNPSPHTEDQRSKLSCPHMARNSAQEVTDCQHMQPCE